MDPHEVTQGDYSRLMGENPSASQGDDLPVENVTWFQAVAYCNARSEEAGLAPACVVDGESVAWDRAADGYRLPTEAEWEYACRAGTTTPFNTETSISADTEANYYGTYPYEIEDNYFDRDGLQTQPGVYRQVEVAPGARHARGRGALRALPWRRRAPRPDRRVARGERGGVMWARPAHLLGSYWGYLLVGLHVGLHIQPALARSARRGGATRTGVLAACAAALAGAWSFSTLDVGTYLTYASPFVFVDAEAPLVLRWAQWLVVGALYALLGVGVRELLGARAARRRGRERA